MDEYPRRGEYYRIEVSLTPHQSHRHRHRNHIQRIRLLSCQEIQNSKTNNLELKKLVQAYGYILLAKQLDDTV